MNFLDMAKSRYSVRNYLPKQVEEEKLMKILEAGRIAPTGANRQPQRLIVVRGADGLAGIGKATNIYGAPVAIIVCADKNAAWKRGFDGKTIEDIDATIVTDHMMLQATELGLGSLWICAFKPDVIREEFHLPGNLIPVNILAIGYAGGTPQSPDRHDEMRLPLAETVFFEKL